MQWVDDIVMLMTGTIALKMRVIGWQVAMVMGKDIRIVGGPEECPAYRT